MNECKISGLKVLGFAAFLAKSQTDSSSPSIFHLPIIVFSLEFHSIRANSFLPACLGRDSEGLTFHETVEGRSDILSRECNSEAWPCAGPTPAHVTTLAQASLRARWVKARRPPACLVRISRPGQTTSPPQHSSAARVGRHIEQGPIKGNITRIANVVFLSQEVQYSWITLDWRDQLIEVKYYIIMRVYCGDQLEDL